MSIAFRTEQSSNESVTLLGEVTPESEKYQCGHMYQMHLSVAKDGEVIHRDMGSFQMTEGGRYQVSVNHPLKHREVISALVTVKDVTPPSPPAVETVGAEMLVERAAQDFHLFVPMDAVSVWAELSVKVLGGPQQSVEVKTQMHLEANKGFTIEKIDLKSARLTYFAGEQFAACADAPKRKKTKLTFPKCTYSLPQNGGVAFCCTVNCTVVSEEGEKLLVIACLDSRNP